ncbi:MAG TPA: TonB-dependent receptor [Flavobacteriales bacterium]|nr:TonB-dependent receptor [Flavobacteriales bacterium]
MIRTLLATALVGAVITGAQAQSDTTLTPVIPDTSAVNRPQLPVFTITADDLDAELGSQDISGILQSSRDVFTAVAGFNFGSARFRIRGYDSENTLVTINGVLVNDLETGWAQWSSWAGLNDVTRWMQVRTGLGATRYNFGGVGGSTDINVRSSSLRKGLRVSYASTNRAYRNRMMVTGSTGLMKNGWSFSFSGSRRWAEEGYVEGTSFDAYAYYLSAEHKINDKHSVSFSGFGAPIVQGRSGVAVQEAYDLAGTSYYNPNWGYQDGKIRNARMTFDHKPLLMASHYFKPSEGTEWNTSLFYTFGRDGSSGLNWFDAKDPRADYYRYLPSYYRETNPAVYAELQEAWRTDVNARQIDWDQLYFANGKNLYTVRNANGILGNDVTGNRSKYIVQEQRADPNRVGLNSVYSKEMSNDRHMTVGGSFNLQRTHYFNTVSDLLGGDYWVDIDQFADRDFNDTIISQNDLDRPNKLVEVGDVFGWDYYMNTRLVNVFGQLEKKWQKVEAYVGASIAQTTFWREGNLRNGRFPETSKGKGEDHSFFNFGIKAGGLYKVTGRHFIAANAAFLSRPPSTNVAYLSPRVHDGAIPGLTNEKVYTGDIGYVVRFPRLKGRATLYYTKIYDQLWSRSFYHDEYLTIVNYNMTGVDQINRGVELGVEANLTSTWQMTAVYAGGDYRYDSRPTATITRNNSPEVFASERTVYWKNYKVGGMPQTAASLGLRYNSPKFWFAGVNVNWFGNIYLDPNPDRRTEPAVDNLVVTDPQWDGLLTQERLDDNMTVDAFAGKSWMIKRKYRIAFNLSVSNVLDNQDFKVGGFEQLRYDRMDVDRFPPKYSYLFGRNYFAMLTFSF